MSNWKQLAGGLGFVGAIFVIDTQILVEPTETPEGMIWIESGSFIMGSDQGLPDERPAHEVRLNGFWIDKYEVTNANFFKFVAETGYETYSEEVKDSLVFQSPSPTPEQPVRPMSWWRLVANADWQHPEGAKDSIERKESHPVVHVTYDDASAYCNWLDKDLHTEAQFEYAARGGLEGEIYSWGSQPRHRHETMTNHSVSYTHLTLPTKA